MQRAQGGLQAMPSAAWGLLLVYTLACCHAGSNFPDAESGFRLRAAAASALGRSGHAEDRVQRPAALRAHGAASMMWWEDFKVGDSVEMGRHSVTAQEIVEFGRRFAPPPV